MLDPEVIAKLKEKYHDIFSSPLPDGSEYIFRPMTFAEFDYLSVRNDWSSAEAEDYIVNTAGVWPENFDTNQYQAGYITMLADEVLDISGFTNMELAQGIFEKAREESNQFREVMRATVLALHPILGISEKDMDDYTFKQLAQKVVLAEQIIRIQKAIQDPGTEIYIDFSSDEEEDYSQDQMVDPIAQRLRAELG